MSRAFGIVTSTPRRVNVFGLQDYRSAGAFSFDGRYRVIDFPISNLSNSGIDNIQVYMNQFPRSLTDHLGTGRQYNINSKSGRLQLLYCDHNNRNEVYNTDISGYLSNMDYIGRLRQEYVIITPCYMVFKQDFTAALDQHIESGADISLLYHKVNNGRDHFLNCRVITLDKDNRVLSLRENRGSRASQYVFMDSYILKRELFMDIINKTAEYSSTYSMAQAISMSCEHQEMDIRGIQHKGYLAAICDLQAYYDANLDTLDIKTARSLFSSDFPIYTTTTDACPTKILPGADVRNSMISDGCTIEGVVENCVIGRGVKVGANAVVRNSIILSYSEIGEGVELDCQVVDKWAKIEHTKAIIGKPNDPGYIRNNDRL